MAFDRRSFLKSLVATSVVPLLDNSFARAMAGYEGLESYLLFQGLFFMEFYENNLIVATPHHAPPAPYHPHAFYKRAHGQQDLIDMPTDPAYTDILPGTVSSFPKEIPQFSYDIINQPKGVLRSSRKYRCKMVLPYPKEIYALRRGSAFAFLPDTCTNVGGDLKYCDQIATVVALVYDPAPNATRRIESYYAEHPFMPSAVETNQALKSAQELCGSDFDLKFLDCMSPTVGVDNNRDLPPDLDCKDEYSIGEIIGVTNANVQNPKGRIVPFIGDDPVLKQAMKENCASKKHKCNQPSNDQVPNKGSQADQNSKSKDYPILAGDVSSCPIFGIRG